MHSIAIPYVPTGATGKHSISFLAGEALRFACAPTVAYDATGKSFRLVLSRTPVDAPLLNDVDFEWVSAADGAFKFEAVEEATFRWPTAVMFGYVMNTTDGIVVQYLVAKVTANPLAAGDAPEFPDPPIDWSDLANIPAALQALANLEPATDKLPYFTADAAALSTITAAARAFLAAVDAAGQRAVLGSAPAASAILIHRDGTQTAFSATADTAISRGTALLSAVAAYSVGDVLLIGPGDHDIGTGRITMTSAMAIVGRGIDVTRILGQYNGGSPNPHAMVALGTNSYLADLTVYANNPTTQMSPVGCRSGDSAFTGARLVRVKIIGAVDGLHVNQNGPTPLCSAALVDCEIYSNYDAVALIGMDPASTFEFHRCTLRAVYNAGDWPSYAGSIGTSATGVSTGGAPIYFYGGKVTVGGASSANKGFTANANVYGGTVIEATGTNPQPFGNAGAVCSADVVFDGSIGQTPTIAKFAGKTPSASWLALINQTLPSPTTMGYVDATSSIQTQLDAKLPLAGGTMTGTLNVGTNTIQGDAWSIDGTGAITANGIDAENSLIRTGGAIQGGTFNGNVFTTGTGTLTLGAGKTFTAANTLTLTGTDDSTLNVGAGGTLGALATITPGAGVATFLATPSGANLASALTTPLPITKGGTGLTSPSASLVTYTLSGVDPTATGNIRVAITDNNGMRFIPTQVGHELYQVTSYTSGTLVTTWGTSSGATDIRSSVTLTSFRNANTKFDAAVSSTVVATVAPAGEVWCNITSPLTGTGMLMRLSITGYYAPP